MDEIEKEGAKPQTVPPAGAPAKPPKPEPSRNRPAQRAFRWLLGILIAAGLGALLVVFTLYIPLRQELDRSRAEVDRAKQQVTELEGSVERFSPLETENEDLQTELDQAELHIALLSARTEIAVAQLALAKADPDKARQALEDTGDTLRKMENLLKPDDKKLVTDLRSRLELAMNGIGVNDYAAASDLDVLSTGLMELEDAYFPVP